MSEFTRVEVHFLDSQRQPRVAVIPLEDKRVEAIFLRKSEDRLSIRLNGKKVVKNRQNPIPDGVKLLPESGIMEGPGQVCYLENGQLKCWDPS